MIFKMTTAEKQQGLKTFVEQEIYMCQSSLVEEAFKQNFFSWDDVLNQYKRFDGALLAPSTCHTCGIDATYLDSETGECETCFDQNRQLQEIYEWWLVSDWLEIKLKMHGEPVLSNNYGSWWGRCTTGQVTYLDDVIRDIYDEIMNY
ncbi:MAG TPA: hypothetical protein VLF89_07040 [Candidatus Saccharimonadales bacterium]|nr:hypothetical protein [Candidatus Saccharimonadales bacterium]